MVEVKTSRGEDDCGNTTAEKTAFAALTGTTITMCCSLPPEILDLVVDHLYDDPTTLKACCVVDKSWIPRTRKHLFAHIEFHAQKLHVELWKKTFPDPSNSPAHYTRNLTIRDIPVITAPDTGEGGWIRTFHSVVHLRLECHGWEGLPASVVPFHGLSPTLRSLHLTATFIDVFDLVCSFPLLEDLALVLLGSEIETDRWNAPSTSPKFTGSLDLRMIRGIGSAIRRLLDLPGGLHFTKITVLCPYNDLGLITDLLSRCSDTLESLAVFNFFLSAFPLVSVTDKHLTARERRHVWGVFP